MSIDRYLYVSSSYPHPRWRTPINACIICIFIWAGKINIISKCFYLFFILFSIDCFCFPLYFTFFIINWQRQEFIEWLFIINLSSIICIVFFSVWCILCITLSHYDTLLYKINFSYAKKFKENESLQSMFEKNTWNIIKFLYIF